MACLNGIASICNNRTIALVDMDCFYVQVEQRRNPHLKGKPCVVVQYKKWRGGGIIAVGYEARKFGVSRSMRGDDAKEKCPDVNLIYVQENRGKADLTVYREASAEVIHVLSTFSDSLERASIDEAYIDLTEAIKSYRMKYNVSEIASKLLRSTNIVNIPTPSNSGIDKHIQSEAFILQRLSLDSNLNLAIGAIVVNEMRDAVLEKTGFTCSAGIAHNKMLAKFVGGMHKPNQQTIIFTEDIPKLYEEAKIRKVRHLGGKLGQALQESFNIKTMKELSALPINKLKQTFGEKTGVWMYSLGQGIDNEPVRIRQLPKSVSCCKNFTGREKLDKISKVSFWLNQLASEICERLDHEVEINNRTAKHLSISLTNVDGTSGVRSCKISRIDVEQITSNALRVLLEFNTSTLPDQWDAPVTYLGMSASKFEDNESGSKSIKDFFVNCASSSDNCESSSAAPLNVSSVNDESAIDPSLSSSYLKYAAKKTVGLERFFPRYNKNANISDSGNDCKIFTNDSILNSDIVTTADRGAKCESIRTLHEDEINENLLTKPFNEQNVDLAQKIWSVGDSQVVSISGKDGHIVDGKPVKDEPTAGINLHCDSSAIPTISNGKEPLLSKFTADDFIVCLKCGKRILNWDLPEHNDFHFAQDLQHDINKASSNAISISLDNKNSKSPPKKKLKRSSASITSFFKAK